jgi:group II intron reverse transcriptase/maturase
MGNTEGALKPDSVSTKQRRIAELARTSPAMSFTSLNHHLDEEWLRYAYDLTRKDGAPGIDGRTATDYASRLEENLRDLLVRIKTGRYFAPPVRRATIPKADGTTRPLGIPTFEDKVAQRAIALLIEPIYEQDFMPCSYGFRPGRSAHAALHDLRSFIMENGARWVLDVDLQKYFDTIDHRHLRAFLDRRVVDGVVRKMIDKWLKAGVLEEGQLRRLDMGTPQGGVISPLLANIFLHYVLDEWFARDVGPRMKRKHAMVRYADDFVMAFEDFLDCRRVLAVLGKRMTRFGLTVHPDKTRMIDFRFRRPDGVRHALTQGTTFDFLGFTHVWGRSRRGKNVIYQRTAKTRFARALRAVPEWCRRFRHLPLPDQHRRLSRMVQGHYAYYGITGNGRRLRWFLHRVEVTWRMWLSRRTRGNPMHWQRFVQTLERYPLPPTRIVHRYAAIASEAAP